MSLSLLVFGVFYSCQGESTSLSIMTLGNLDYEAATGLSPEFLGTISNMTISQGRDASFACSVRNLGGYKVNRNNDIEYTKWKRSLECRSS